MGYLLHCFLNPVLDWQNETTYVTPPIVFEGPVIKGQNFSYFPKWICIAWTRVPAFNRELQKNLSTPSSFLPEQRVERVEFCGGLKYLLAKSKRSLCHSVVREAVFTTACGTQATCTLLALLLPFWSCGVSELWEANRRLYLGVKGEGSVQRDNQLNDYSEARSWTNWQSV